MALQALQALQTQGPPLALVDACGCLGWFSTAWQALWPSAADGVTLAELLGDLTCTALQTQGVAEAVAADCSTWRISAMPGGAGCRVLRAENVSALLAAQGQVHRLQERLDLVQDFSDTGVFERDASTLEGTWDHHMYRIWGLPERPPGSVAPAYADVAQMIFREDRRSGAFEATVGQGGVHTQRMRMRRPDGQVRHLHTQWKVLSDARTGAGRVLGINTDDTEVYELANRAEQLRTELDVALKLGHIALWRYDLSNGILYLDARGAEVIGVPFGDNGVSLALARARIHPDDLPQVQASVELTLRTGEPSDMQLRYPRPGGGWRHVLLRRALQRDAEGNALGFVGVLMDVTERVEESHRALEYARRLEASAEAARIGLWSTQLGTPLPTWNRRMYQLFGLDPKDGPLPLGNWLARCVHPGDRARLHRTVVAWWQSGSGDAEVEFRVVRPSDGAMRRLVVRGQIDAVGEGGSMRAEGVAIDVTEQQRTLHQLRETVERMTLTTQALGLGTWRAEHAHSEVRWDAQMFRLRGVDSPGRVIPASEIPTYIHPADREGVLAAQVGQVLDGKTWHNVFRVQWPDGQVRWITSQSVPLVDEYGRPDGPIGVNWDSTEAQRSAEAARDREVAVAESHAKSQAMSRISHELRTPLNAVLGFTQLLRAGQGDPERQALWLAHIENAGRHLLALIDDVLELSSAEVGELRLASVAVPCAEVLDAALPLVAGLAQQQGIALRRLTVEGVVLADPVRLRQVLINLLSNAIKYNRPGGEVRIWSRVSGRSVALHVADTGRGIEPERLRNAFEPFNRLGAEVTGVEGSGLGLSIVKALVEHMGGQVEAHSRLGEGSEFIVTLPAAAVAADRAFSAADATTPTAGPLRAAQVLYIEDNPVNALLVQEMLKHRPAITLLVADDGTSGVRRARECVPDLMLVDMQLPDIDGHAVLRALRADPLTAGIRCVALSASATPDDIEAARAAGFTDYWTKPIELRQFLAGIDGLLGHSRTASSMNHRMLAPGSAAK
jgi:signal transduction histidine kinase/CheY-like chemotaxis protein